MSSRGSITLGDLRGKLSLLEIACHRCDRRGQLSLARLIEQHGADKGLPELRTIVATNCPHLRSASINDRCGAYYSQLAALFPASPRR